MDGICVTILLAVITVATWCFLHISGKKDLYVTILLAVITVATWRWLPYHYRRANQSVTILLAVITVATGVSRTW